MRGPNANAFASQWNIGLSSNAINATFLESLDSLVGRVLIPEVCFSPLDGRKTLSVLASGKDQPAVKQDVLV